MDVEQRSELTFALLETQGGTDVKVAVTGAAGFIGKWLTAELSSFHEVVMIDKVSTDPACVTANLLDEDVVRDWLIQTSPDVCYHLAAQVGRVFGEQDISHTVRSNAEMTTIVAKWCGELGIRLAYVSTSEVYGDQGDIECGEYGRLVLPHNLYGLTKRWGEEVSRLFAPKDLVIARLSMPYGPGVPPGRGRRAMDTMLWQAHHQKPIIVHRGAERSWCWVGDTVRGLRMLIEQPTGGTYNVGRADAPVSMAYIAVKACELAGAPTSLIQEIDPPGAQTVVKRLSTDRIRRLGWRPEVELDEGMTLVYEHVSKYPWQESQ